MARYTLVVRSSPADGKEAKYNDWYSNIHLAEVLNVPGFFSATRHGPRRPADGRPVYIAFYGFEADDPAAKIEELIALSADMNISDAIDMGTITLEVYADRFTQAEEKPLAASKEALV